MINRIHFLAAAILITGWIVYLFAFALILSKGYENVVPLIIIIGTLMCLAGSLSITKILLTKEIWMNVKQLNDLMDDYRNQSHKLKHYQQMYVDYFQRRENAKKEYVKNKGKTQ